MKVLITGASGLIGSHLCDFLLDNTNYEIYAINRPRTEKYRGNEITYFDCDVTDFVGLLDIFQKVQPDIVYHLAGQSYFSVGRDNPQYTIDTNVMGTVNVLEAIRRQGKQPKKIIIASSAASYGKVDKYPTTEETIFKPLSLYGVSKSSQDLLGWQYFMNYDMPIIRARFYITVGIRQGSVGNAINAFASQIALIEKGKLDKLEVGNLSTKRDITDVRDSVKALHMLSFLGVNGEAYNICSEKPRLMKDVLDELISLSTCEIKVEQDGSRFRPSDIPLECGSYAKLHEHTGWSPEIEFRDTLSEILNYWRNKV